MGGIADAQNHRLVKIKGIVLVEQSGLRRPLNMSHQGIAVDEILHSRLLLDSLEG